MEKRRDRSYRTNHNALKYAHEFVESAKFHSQSTSPFRFDAAVKILVSHYLLTRKRCCILGLHPTNRPSRELLRTHACDLKKKERNKKNWLRFEIQRVRSAKLAIYHREEQKEEKGEELEEELLQKEEEKKRKRQNTKRIQS